MDICRLHSHVPIMHCDHKHIKSSYYIFCTKNKVQDCFSPHLINSIVPAYSVLHPVYFLSFLPFGISLQLSGPSDPSTSPCTHYNVQSPLSHYQICNGWHVNGLCLVIYVSMYSYKPVLITDFLKHYNGLSG